MPENNQILSVEGQLVGMPLAGPESFSQQQLDYLKRALGVDETVLWTGTATNSTVTLNETADNFERIILYYRNGDGIHNSTEVIRMSGNQNISLTAGAVGNNAYVKFGTYRITGTTIEPINAQSFMIWYEGSFGAGRETNNFYVYKIVGIHRISGGN